MASPSPSTYPDWKAPRDDGQTLLWPGPAKLLEQTRENHRRLSGAATTRIQNVPLPEIRSRQRQWIGQDHHDPIVGDAHQAELHHPGVWVKRVLTQVAASRLSGQALHVGVDTDAPKHLILRWIGDTEPITDDPDLHDAHWTSLLDAPTPAHLAHLQRRLEAAGLAAKPVATDFLVSLRRLSLEQPKIPSALTNAMHELDWSLGLRHHALLAGPLWSSEPFLVFAHHLIARAGQFAREYNAALADYRREKKVRTPTRPMPDLAAFDDSAELPFWLDALSTGQRTRPTAFVRGGGSDGGGYVLTTPGGDEFDFDPSADGWEAAQRLSHWFRRNHLRLSPRALTLTMFLRLFVFDQFVHGIGGAQYDQITDRLIASHFKLEPPTFSVATATMYLPEAAGQSPACVACVAQEGHRLRHSLLGERKMQLVGQIDAAPRNSPQRYAAFAAMHRELATAGVNHPALAKWEQQLREAQTREAEESALFDRELFYALQPRDRLEEMVRRIESHF